MICCGTSKAEWIGIWKPLKFPRFEGHDGLGLVELDKFVELAGERGLKW